MSYDALREKFMAIHGDPAPLDRFLEHAPASALEGIEHLGLLIIAPEAFARGVGRAITDKVESAGFILLDSAVLDPMTMDEIGMMFVPRWMPARFRWWLLEERYRMGPSVALLLSHNEGNPIAARLDQGKGRAQPQLAAVGTWRRELGALNGVLNLMHTSDGPPELVRHATPFFGAQRLARALNAARAVRNGASPPTSWHALRESTLGGLDSDPPVCPRFIEAYASLLLRLLFTARTGGDQLAQACRALEYLRTQGQVWGLPEEGLAAVSLVRRCLPVLPPPTALLIDALTDLPQCRYRQWERLLDCRATGLPLDRWSRLVLMSTLFFADRELLSPEVCSAVART